MSKVIYCKNRVANSLKAEFSAQTRNEDITGNTFASGALGMKVIQKDDEFFKGMKTKEGKPADMIEVDESAFKMMIPTFDSMIKEQVDDILNGKATLYNHSSQLINRLCNRKGDADGEDTEG